MKTKNKLALALSVSLAFIALRAGAGFAADAPATNEAVNAAAATTQPATAPLADHVVVRGIGLEIKRSEIDQVLNNYRAANDDMKDPLPDGADLQVMDQLIDIRLNLLKKNDADIAAGKKEGGANLTRSRKATRTKRPWKSS